MWTYYRYGFSAWYMGQSEVPVYDRPTLAGVVPQNKGRQRRSGSAQQTSMGWSWSC